MTKRNSIIAIIATLTLLAMSSTVSFAGGATDCKLSLFGVELKDVKRDDFRVACKQTGCIPVREDKDYWVDVFEVNGKLKGASDLHAGFVKATDSFAFAQYTFKGFMDTKLVERVIGLVSSKYGRPSSVQGNYGLGPVKAVWDIKGGMMIEVSRNWPDTTTYLIYVDNAAYSRMDKEIQAMRLEKERVESKAQNAAF